MDILQDIVGLIKKYFSDMTPESTTDLFVKIILCAAFVFLTILLCNATYKIIKLLYIRSKIKNLASNSNGNYFLEENKLSAFASLSSQARRFSEILQSVEGKLYATQDVESVSYALWAPPLLRSRFLPAGAAILTGLGVLGTFAGLLIALSKLNTVGGNMHTQALQAAITQMADGASVAFETSVWGVSLSLLLTCCEKLLTSGVSRSLLSLQALLASVFPPFPLPELLRRMSVDSKNAADCLGSLATQLGDRMQQSLDSFYQNMLDNLSQASASISEAISNSLTQTLKETLIPSIDNISTASQDLANRQAHSSEDALKQLLTAFTDKMGDAGNNQKESMQKATEEMKQTMTGFADSMNTLISSLRSQEQDFEQRQQDRMDKMDAVFRNMTAAQDQNLEKASKDMLSVLSSFRDVVRDELARQSRDMGKVADDIQTRLEKMSTRMTDFFSQLDEHQKSVSSSYENQTKVLKKQVQDVFDKHDNAMKNMEEVITTHVSSTKNLLDQGKSLQDSIGQQENLINGITKSMYKTGTSLETASKHLQTFSDQIKNSIDRSAESTEKAMGVAQRIGAQEDTVARNLREILDGLSSLQGKMRQVSDSLSSSVNTASDSYRMLSNQHNTMQQKNQQYLRELDDRMTEQITDLDDRMTEQVENLDNMMGDLLSEYGKQTTAQLTDCLNAWNTQTQRFFGNLTNTVQAMAEVVDGMDNRPKN